LFSKVSWSAYSGVKRLLLLEIIFPEELDNLSDGTALVATKQCTALTS